MARDWTEEQFQRWLVQTGWRPTGLGWAFTHAEIPRVAVGGLFDPRTLRLLRAATARHLVEAKGHILSHLPGAATRRAM